MPESAGRFSGFVFGTSPGSAAQGGPAGPAPSHWFAFRDGKILVARDSGSVRSPVEVPCVADLSVLGLHPRRAHFLGTTAAGAACWAAEIRADEEPAPGWSFEGLRPLFPILGEDLFRVAGRATQILDWDRTHRFCGSCGAPVVEKPGERAKVCPACGHENYPRISPAVIVAVARGREILLARAHRFPPDLFSVLAGFVEPGETLEECVRREVKEETGIEVGGVRYFASQPWPFPNSLMLAFTAEYASGEIVPEPGELAEARWFAVDALPSIPGRLTVARKLIDWFVGSRSARG